MAAPMGHSAAFMSSRGSAAGSTVTPTAAPVRLDCNGWPTGDPIANHQVRTHHRRASSLCKGGSRKRFFVRPTMAALAGAAAAFLSGSWLVLWLLKPTPPWKKAWRVIEDGAGRTFLGDYGINVLFFGFPLIGASALGYVYLHSVYNRQRAQNRKRRIQNIRSRLVGVTGPFGVVSIGELLGVLLFAAILVWTYCFRVAGDLKKTTPYPQLNLNWWQLGMMHMSVRFGSLGEICLAVLLLPVLRGMSVLRIIGVQFESSVQYHTWIANTMILLLALHGAGIMFIWFLKNKLLQELPSWSRVGRVNVAGAVALILGVTIWATSRPSVRRTRFHTFYLVHHLYLLFILFFLFHAGYKHFCVVLPAILLFALDKIQRLVQARHEVRIVAARRLPGEAVELVLPKMPCMEYSPTSVIFLNIPSISRLQWHPFTISSCHHEGDATFSVIIKCHGDWTKSLYSKLSNPEDTEANPAECLSVTVEGPYGPPDCPYERYKALVLVAGGSGITPFLSMLQDISARSTNQMEHPTSIRLIYCVRRIMDLSMMAPLSSLLPGHGHLEDVKLHIFVTQEGGSSSSAQDILHDAFSLKRIPRAHSGSPRNSISAQGGLLWRSGVALSSYLLFLGSMICLNHLFKQKAKVSSMDKVPSWVDDLITIASFTIAVSCCAMMTALSSRIKSARSNEHEPQKSQEGSHQQELEAKDVALACDIRFGGRPNLEELLSSLSREIDETEIGVFVCGPDGMKVAAASFCMKNSGNRRKQSFCFHSLNFSL